MSGKAILILVLGIAGIISVAFINLAETSGQATNNMIGYYNKQSSQNIAQTGIHMALRELTDSNTWRNGYNNISLFSGNLTTALVDTTFDSLNVVKITSTGTVGAGTDLEATTTSIAYTVIGGGSGFIPASVLAAITTNNPVETSGTLVVDGRDHDLNGNLVAGSGTYGLWTTNSFKRKGNSKLGATTAGTDYSPTKSMNDDIRLEGQTYPGGYPSNPDEVMGGAAKGYPSGKLKSIAQSGKNGSQYVTNPSALNHPLKGVTYVELASGDTWNPANITGEGILIVHNSSTDAVIKNINWETFKDY
ncbi:MAG: hypothetical protein U5K00_06610 [Melioribacteraceae bacterium]|nr:hypothetical protein [Melioribacteraceae bacterium]